MIAPRPRREGGGHWSGRSARRGRSVRKGFDKGEAWALAKDQDTGADEKIALIEA